MRSASHNTMATLGDIAHVTNRWYIESGGLVQGSYCGRRLRVAVALQRRSEGEKGHRRERGADTITGRRAGTARPRSSPS